MNINNLLKTAFQNACATLGIIDYYIGVPIPNDISLQDIYEAKMYYTFAPIEETNGFVIEEALCTIYYKNLNDNEQTMLKVNELVTEFMKEVILLGGEPSSRNSFVIDANNSLGLEVTVTAEDPIGC